MLQLQEDNDELHLQLKLKDEELKRTKEDIRVLSEKLLKNKTARLSEDDSNMVCCITYFM